ncbi:MAG: Fur family zinc uptake transcriptional regulator [Flavobacteriales bacterium]
MKKQQLNNIMDKAQHICAHSGGRLTEKRKRILELLLVSGTPLSAYEVADAYNKTAEASMPAMSVYRILDFLESEQLVHKLSSANKYVACSHIACSHAHEIPQFLMCGKCQSVKEIAIAKSIIDELDHQVAGAGYKLMNSQLELQCLCDNCLASAA